MAEASDIVFPASDEPETGWQHSGKVGISRASGNLDTRCPDVTMEVRALDGQVRGQPPRSFSPRLSPREPALEPVQLRLGAVVAQPDGSH